MKTFKKNKYSLLSNLSKYTFVFVIAFSLLIPVLFVQACGNTGEPACVGTNTGSGTNTGNSGTNTGGVTVNTGITNPLGPSLSTLPGFIKAILDIVLVVGVPIIALAIIYSGFLFVAARGNAEELTKAKKTLMYTLIGGALLLGSWVVASAIQGTVNDIKSANQ